MSKKLKANILLMTTALIWGTSFVAQKEGATMVEGFTFSGIRLMIAGIALIVVVLVMNRGKASIFSEERKPVTKRSAIGGACCGVALFAASTLQQCGIAYTTAGKAAFITTLYVAFVPILGLFIGKKIKPLMWVCIGMSCIGLYLLCMTDASFSLQYGDTLVILCGLGYAVHILVADHFVEDCDGVLMSCVQFLVAGVIGMISMFIFEDPDIHQIIDCWFPLLYLGIVSGGIGYTFQILGQRDAEPAVASLILCLESVFGALSGAIFLKEVMTPRELIGCAVLFAAVIISNLPEKKKEE